MQQPNPIIILAMLCNFFQSHPFFFLKKNLNLEIKSGLNTIGTIPTTWTIYFLFLFWIANLTKVVGCIIQKRTTYTYNTTYQR